MKIDIIPLLVAVLGAGGFGAFFREIVSVILKVAGGVSARESKRKVDIVAQRDEAIDDARDAWAQRDVEAANRRAEQEYSARLRRQLIENGIEPGASPVYEATVTREQLTELRNKEEP